ncbi:MAG: hypothetical protein H0X44_03500 [Acidobacteria bacterium]|nr:hypothetical protein [Acidobacteriota bacterium]
MPPGLSGRAAAGITLAAHASVPTSRRRLLMAGRAIVVWAGIAVLAIANGAFRDAVLLPRLGETAARSISTLLLAAAILVVAAMTIGWISTRPQLDAWRIGALWLALTVAFEFLAGHYLFRVPWHRILADYNILNGRIWIVVLIVTLLAPVAAAFRGRFS